MTNIWISRNFTSVKILLDHVKLRQNDQYLQEWNSAMSLSSKGKIYNIFKENFRLEDYLTTLPQNIWTRLLKFRTSNHHLPVETGRWNNIPLEDRMCTLCNNNDIGDEFHYLFTCPFFNNSRKTLLKPYYYNKPNTLKFKQLMTDNKISIRKKLCKLIKEITDRFNIS